MSCFCQTGFGAALVQLFMTSSFLCSLLPYVVVLLKQLFLLGADPPDLFVHSLNNQEDSPGLRGFPVTGAF